jgi:ATP-binding cassette, subfamily B, bacterial HlyB/CyaB
MPSPELEKFRAQSKLFGLLDEPGQLRLMKVVKTEQHAAGEVVVKQGDQGDAFFIVSDGKLEVFVEEDGKSRQIASLERGAFFGEIAALLGETRSATVKAASAVKLMRFEMQQVKDIISDYPTVRQVLVRLALKRGEDNLTEQMNHDFT